MIDMEYSLIIEKAKFIFLFAFIMGMFVQWFASECNIIIPFLFRLIKNLFINIRKLVVK